MTDLLPALPDDVRLTLLHAPADRRPPLAALFALDERLKQVVRTTTEPLVGQMRIAWWRTALEALDQGPAPAEPVLTALARTTLAHGVSGGELALVADGWEALLAADPVDLADHAVRGRVLFRTAAQVLAATWPEETIARTGEGWALADLSRHLSDPGAADQARALALRGFATAFAAAWPKPLRPIGLLALLARQDLLEAGRATRAWRTARFGLTGRG